MTKSTLYRMGEFIAVDDPIEWNRELDLSHNLAKEGYKLSLNVGTEDFPYIEIWEGNPFDEDIELVYPFFAVISMDCINCRDLYFENWINVLHFLQNYSSWAKNLVDVEKALLEIYLLSLQIEQKDKEKY